MDVLNSDLVDQIAKLDNENDENDEEIESNSSKGPWVLVASAFGLGKRVPVTHFRLQIRAGMGLKAIKF